VVDSTLIRNDVTHISFGMSAHTLSPDIITEMMGIAPTHAFKKGDIYSSQVGIGHGRTEWVERKKVHGVWSYSTAAFVTSDELDDHAEYLLDKIEPAATRLHALLNDPKYHIGIWLWYIGHFTCSIRSDLMRRLASLCKEIVVTCWDVEDRK